MTLEELKIQKKLFIETYEKYPKRQGYRGDLKGISKFNRSKQILSHLTHIWPNSNIYIGHNLEKIYNYLLKEKDDDKLFFSRKLFYHKWKLGALIKFMEDGFLDMDVENKFEDLLYNDLTASVKKTKEALQNYYKKKIGHLYVMNLVSNNKLIPKLPVKKIGYSKNLTARLKSAQTWLPYTIVPITYIIGIFKLLSALFISLIFVIVFFRWLLIIFMEYPLSYNSFMIIGTFSVNQTQSFSFFANVPFDLGFTNVQS